jgi:4-hydroxy-3-methylbut-2-enyl diphosphate reductase IspH
VFPGIGVAKQGDQKIRKKKCQIFQRIAPKVTKPKQAKISTTKLNWKAQNLYIKLLLKP